MPKKLLRTGWRRGGFLCPQVGGKSRTFVKIAGRTNYRQAVSGQEDFLTMQIIGKI